MNFLSIFVFITIFLSSVIAADTPLEEITQSYNGIPGCECFLHCSYRTSIPQPNRVKNPLSNPCSHFYSYAHPKLDQDRLWHYFVDSIWEIGRSYGCYDTAYPHPSVYRSIEDLLSQFGYKKTTDHCLLRDYLNSVEHFYQMLMIKRKQCTELRNKLVEEDPIRYGGEAYVKEIENIRQKEKNALQNLAKIKANILREYQLLLTGCRHDENPDNLAYIYNKGLLCIAKENHVDSLSWIEKFIHFCEKNDMTELLNSEIYASQGKVYFDVGLYHNAIKALSKAIEKDPLSTDAYFTRAKSYFENENFGEAIEDYLTSDARKIVLRAPSRVSCEFERALVDGIYNGMKTSISDLGPFLCNSAQGLNRALWIFVDHPIDATTNFANTCYEMCEDTFEYFKTLRKEELDELYIELREFYENYAELNDTEKGNLIGQTIGKYGTDVFSGGMIIKGAIGVKYVLTTKRMKDANAICNFEAMIASQKNNQKIVTSSAQHATQKKQYFKNLKIEVDKQNKHIVGKHNYEPEKNRSIFEHQAPQDLVNKFAGSGIAKNNMTPGSPGYQEVVNFGEFIGYDVNLITLQKTPTTWGTIHYSNNGVHIVPYFPRT